MRGYEEDLMPAMRTALILGDVAAAQSWLKCLPGGGLKSALPGDAPRFTGTRQLLPDQLAGCGELIRDVLASYQIWSTAGWITRQFSKTSSFEIFPFRISK